MKIVCSTVEEFLENLNDENPQSFLRGTIQVSVSRNPLDGTKRDAVKFSVNLQASVLVNMPEDEGQYLIEVGEDCGIDYQDASMDLAGSDVAAEKRAQIIEYCEANGLRVRPGMIEV